MAAVSSNTGSTTDIIEVQRRDQRVARCKVDPDHPVGSPLGVEYTYLVGTQRLNHKVCDVNCGVLALYTPRIPLTNAGPLLLSPYSLKCRYIVGLPS